MKLSKEVAKYYYTAEQARKVLGIDEQRLQYLVRRERIHRTNLPTYAQGVYLKKEIDDMVEQTEAIIIAQAAEGLAFRKAKIDDLKEEYKLARTIFGTRADTPEIQQGKRAFIQKNPNIDYHLYDEGNLVGCIHIIPLKHQAIMDFLEGRGVAWLIDPENIEQFEPGKPLECLLLDALTTPGVEPTKRSAYAAYMITKLIKILTEMGSRGVEISKAYGASRTPSGKRIFKNAGFKEIKEYENGGVTFELDITNSDEKILRRYKEALEQQKIQQEEKATPRKPKSKRERKPIENL
jgi:hypothetical protein